MARHRQLSLDRAEECNADDYPSQGHEYIRHTVGNDGVAIA